MSANSEAAGRGCFAQRMNCTACARLNMQYKSYSLLDAEQMRLFWPFKWFMFILLDNLQQRAFHENWNLCLILFLSSYCQTAKFCESSNTGRWYSYSNLNQTSESQTTWLAQHTSWRLGESSERWICCMFSRPWGRLYVPSDNYYKVFMVELDS